MTDDRIDRFIAAACGETQAGGCAAAEQMLADDPLICRQSIFAAAVAGDVETVLDLTAADPSVATIPGGPHGWPPLLYACHSRLGVTSARRDGMVGIAKRLLDGGADPNSSFLGDRRHPDLRLSALYAAAGVTGHAGLVRLLLGAGADPNDGESLFHAAEHEHFDCLELLLAHGGDLNDTRHPAGNTPLHWLLDWAYGRRALEWLLAHGADPEVRVGPWRETALHVATRRRRVEAIEILLGRRIDIDAKTAGGKTAFAHARRRGFDDVADLLRRHGADTTLSPADDLSAALLADDLDRARAIIAAAPDMVPGLGPEDARILPDLAGWPDAVALLLDAGADIEARGLDGGTALHQAAWFGFPETVAVLLGRHAPLDVRGDDHDMTPLGWVAHGSRSSRDAERRADAYVRVTRALLEAGASRANPHDPEGDPTGRWLLEMAAPPVAAVLRES